MSMNPVLPTLGVAAFVATGWLVVANRLAQTEVNTPFVSAPLIHEPYDASKKDRDVAFHEGRVRRDPGGAIGWSMLSGAYLARAREQDSYADAIKAEMAARKSLGLRMKGNLGGQTRLVNSLLQEHRFLDALATDEKALKIWGPEPELNQLHADILIEVGRYADASKAIADHPGAYVDYPSGKAVKAHLAIMTGHADYALTLLQSAYSDVDENPAATNENLSWFKEKMGEAQVSLGQPVAAKLSFEAATWLYPRGYKAYAGLARIAASRGAWNDVIRFGEQSNAIAPMPDMLALVGDAMAQIGDEAGAEKQYKAVVALAGKPSGPANGLHEFAGASGGHGHTLDRQYAMFCADHDRDLDGGYACALRELQARRDAYAFDTMAWVCLKRGDKVEAQQAINRALSTGLQDARVLYHAGMIATANGRSTESVAYLGAALSLPGNLTAIEQRDAQAALPKS